MTKSTVWITGVVALTLGLAACNKSDSADATEHLEQSFQTSEPDVKQAIQTVVSSLNSGQYAEATRALEPVVTGRQLTEEQKQAVGIALQQVNQAIASNPSLDTEEMYQMRAKMFQAVHSGPRF